MTQHQFLEQSKILNNQVEQIQNAKRQLRQTYIDANKKADIGQIVQTNKGQGIIQSIDVLSDGFLYYVVNKIKGDGKISSVILTRTNEISKV